MRYAIREQVSRWSAREWLFAGWSAMLLLAFGAGAAGGWYFLALVPAVLLLIAWTIVDYRAIFFVLLACIPLSTEVVLPNGFGTDLPTEPLIIGLMLVAVILFLSRNRTFSGEMFRHPLTMLLLIHIGWIFAASLQSDLFVVSLKFSLAKIWYVAVFYFLAYYLLRGEQDVHRMVLWIFWPLLFTVLVVMFRHSLVNFSFAEVHKVLHPFQRNHVNYAASLALFFPLLWLLLGRYRRWGAWWWGIIAVMGIFLAAIYFSYTRAAYGALMLAFGAYFVFRLRLIKPALALGTIVLVLGLGYYLSGNRFLELAPNYDTTVSHREFGSLLEATARGEDISTMERLYRWVAGVEMSRQNPFFGYGPGNFVTFYRSYTITSFKTYVSDNEEQSGIHSYFLMTLVEQGWPGLLFFILLSFYMFIKGEQIYHQTRIPRRKRTVMAILLMMVVIYAFLLINDLIETDKVGSFFFMGLAILVRLDLLNRREILSANTHSKEYCKDADQQA